MAEEAEELYYKIMQLKKYHNDWNDEIFKLNYWFFIKKVVPKAFTLLTPL
jgi:hypothetical protein